MSALQYGWGEHGNTDEPFWITFSRCTREPKNWKEEIYAAARAITNSTTKPLWLCLSGGIDSEVMCQAFFDQGINFSVITVEHTAGTNKHDIAFAKRWCIQHGIHQNIVYFDMPRLLTEGIQAYLQQGYATRQIFRYFQLRLLEQVEQRGGYAIFGGGEQLYHADPLKPSEADEAYLDFDPGYAIPLEWCRRNKTEHEPYFYFSTPELCSSFLQIPIVSFATRNPDIFRNPRNAYLFKRIIHQTNWPALQPRQKFDEYKQIDQLRKSVRESIEVQFATQLQGCRLPVSEMVRQLSPKVA